MRSARRLRQLHPSGGRLWCPRGSHKGLCTGSAGCRARTGTSLSGPRPAATHAHSVFWSGLRPVAEPDPWTFLPVVALPISAANISASSGLRQPLLTMSTGVPRMSHSQSVLHWRPRILSSSTTMTCIGALIIISGLSQPSRDDAEVGFRCRFSTDLRFLGCIKGR